jgi:hypothetical protein
VVARRLELWLSAVTQRSLAPLFALRAAEGGEHHSVSEVAKELANSLGVLERAPIKARIQALDQSARATLRKYGVRFGAYYILVPAVLKPASRAFALHLWSLQPSPASDNALVEALVPLASSGRTSIRIDPRFSVEDYRVAGFRLCGDRAVRVDIVERLSEMIRAAFGQQTEPGSLRPAKAGFVVNSQMVSLTGCSGEAFSSILRSLGFESYLVSPSNVSVGCVQAPCDSRAGLGYADPQFELTEENLSASPRTRPNETTTTPTKELGSIDSGRLEDSRFPNGISDRDAGSPAQTGGAITVWRPARRFGNKRKLYNAVVVDPRSRKTDPTRISASRFDSNEETAVGAVRLTPGDHSGKLGPARAVAAPTPRLRSYNAASNSDSPFAKLLQLRALLESQGKKA